MNTPPPALLRQNAEDAAAFLRALANPDRLMLLCSLVDTERCVSELEMLTGIRQPSLSQQLGILRDEGLAQTRREGKFIYYRAAPGPALDVLSLLHATYCQPPVPTNPPPEGEAP